MKQSKYFSRWKPRYFRLEDGFLTYYDKKSLVGTHKNKVQKISKPENISCIYSVFRMKRCSVCSTGNRKVACSLR